MRSLIPLNYDSAPKKCRPLPLHSLKRWPNLAALAHSGGGWGRSFFNFFLRENEAENLEIWKSEMVRFERSIDSRVSFSRMTDRSLKRVSQCVID
jgi:hypothetical protein